MPIKIRKKAPDSAKKPSGPKAYGVSAKSSTAISSAALERENVFNPLYGNDGSAGAFQPPYDPDMLNGLVETNNMLGACIEAMVTNIDGTGFELGPADGMQDEEIPDDIKEKVTKFFENPWPGTSFKEMRKRVRRDIESTGNAYIEVVRNAVGDLALMRRLDPGITRVMRYDDKVFEEDVFSPVLGTTVKVRMKRRRFAQYYFGKFVYFKEFGAPQVLDQDTGQWVEGAKTPALPEADIVESTDATTDYQVEPAEGDVGPITPTAENLQSTAKPVTPATEIIHLMAVPHHILPYGIPRWIAQTPSVVGSRKAEEFNLGFFDAGGVPPMMIIVQGGETGDKVEQALKDLYYSKGQHKQIATILNIAATGGDLDSPGKASVTVERFGAERQKDGMFSVYDKDTGNKVRRSFRIPPLFVGDTQDYTYATATASYQVGESQVFKPERDRFDEMVNAFIMPALLKEKSETVKFRSLPLATGDSELQIEAVTLAATEKAVDREELIDTLNQITGLNMTASEMDFATGELPSSVANEKEPPPVPGYEGGPAKLPNPLDPNKAPPKPGAKLGKKPVPGAKKPVKKEDLDIEEIMEEEVIEVIRKGETGRRPFDAVEWLRTIDAEKRDLFGRRVGKAIFACAECEEVSAGKLALKMLESQTEN